MASFASNFLRGQKIGRMTLVQEERMREKKRKAAKKRKWASDKRKEEATNLKLKARIEAEKTRRAEIKLFRGS